MLKNNFFPKNFCRWGFFGADILIQLKRVKRGLMLLMHQSLSRNGDCDIKFIKETFISGFQSNPAGACFVKPVGLVDYECL